MKQNRLPSRAKPYPTVSATEHRPASREKPTIGKQNRLPSRVKPTNARQYRPNSREKQQSANPISHGTDYDHQ